MNKFKTLKLFLLGIIFIAQQSVAQNYQRLTVGTMVEGAQAYTLPKIAFNVELFAVTKEYKKGNQWVDNYSDEELTILSKKYGLDPKIYKLVKGGPAGVYTNNSLAEDSIKLTSSPLPDFTKIFFTYPKKRWNISQSSSFTYGTDGILTDAEVSSENKTFDLVIKGISSLASIISASKGVSHYSDSRLTKEELDKILASYSKLDGQNNYEVYKDLKTSLEKQYAKVFAEYFYSQKTTTKSAKFQYCPSKKPEYNTEMVLDAFELTPGGDFHYNTSIENDIVWSKNIKPSALTKPYQIKLKLLNKVYQQMEYYSDNNTSSSYMGYNVPAKVLVSIITPEKEELLLDVYKLPQFGKVAYINAHKVKLTFQLDPLTGELKKLATETKAISEDNVANTAAAISSSITAVKAEDADTKLDKEVKRLENEKKKRDLIKELDDNQ